MSSLILKITLFFVAMITSTLSYSLPSEKEFKKMCNSIYENQNAKELQKILQQASADDCIRWLSNFNKYYMSPVVYAAYSGNIPILEVLLTNCTKLGLIYYLFTTSDGSSMLTIAARENNTELIKYLLDNNHPVKIDLGYNSSHALHLTAINNNITAFRLIFQHQKECQLIHQKDHNGFTPINYLIENSQKDFIIDLLKLHPVDKNNPPLSKDNMSYLHYAVLYEIYDVIEILLQQGLDCRHKSIFGITPLDMSKIHRNKQIENLLLSYLSKKNYLRLRLFNVRNIKQHIICCTSCTRDEYSYLY